MKSTRLRSPFVRSAAGFALLALFASGCLKSRVRNSEGGDASSDGYQTKVVPVQDQNQKIADELRDEINQQNARIDELQRRNEELSRTLGKSQEKEQQIRDMDAKLQELQASQAAMIEALQKKEQERQAERERQAKEKEVPKAEPADDYDTGRAAFRNKDYEGAIESLTRYLKYPKAKRAEEALFMRAESFYAKDRHQKAILDYDELQKKFPKSKSAPKALLRTGQSFEALGMKSDAKGFYQEVLDKYPKSAEAKTAKVKLK